MKYFISSLTILFCAILFASDYTDTIREIEVKATRSMDPIKVDGYLDESVWQNGNCVKTFLQRDPVEGV